MRRTQFRGRCKAAARLAIFGLRTVQLSIVLAGILLATSPCALALNPALDVSQYAHTAWKNRDGFSKGQISSIAQTPDGYLWLGTEFGLFRFDGVRNVRWEPPPGQQLPSSYICSLLASHDGTLWIGTLNGLASWKDGKLTLYRQLAGQALFRLVEDREGTVWADGNVVPFGKLCAIRHDNVQCFGEDGSLDRGAFNLYEDSKGNFWAGVKEGLWRWKPGPPKFYSLPGEANGIQAMGEDVDGNLLVGWKSGIYRFSDGKTQKYALPGIMAPVRARRMLRDRDGGLWIGTQTEGLVHIHQGRTDVFLSSDGLSGENIYDLFEDREGNIWVATNNGLDRFREFTVATFTANQGLQRALVGAILADRDGSVWVSTYAGLSRWRNAQFTVPLTGSAARDGKLHGQAPNSLFQDNRGRIWISTNREFGYLERGRFIPVDGLPGGPILGIAQVREGSLWIANEQFGLFQLRPNNTVLSIPWATLGHKDYASALASDVSQGALWLGFHLGGIALFSDGKIRETYSVSDGLGEGRVNSLRTDQDGTLWAATSGGLSRLKNGRVTTLTSKNGLPCDTVHWTTEDDAHSLWLYSACGLVRIDHSEWDDWTREVDQHNESKRTVKAKVFDNSDGVRILADAGHFTPQVAKASDGTLLFSPWDGVSAVDPNHLPFNKDAPPVYIEQITADRKAYNPASYGNGHVPLPAQIRDLQIDYTALSLVVPEKIRFRYKLEGRDNDWQDAGNRRQAFYTDLPPRNYRFRVMACNNNGVWNEEGAFLDFSVAPAYYQTTWFRLSCVTAFLALLWGLHQLRLRQLAREFNAGLEARVNERTRIARDLHDTLLQGFQGLLLQFRALSYQLPDSSEFRKKLENLIDKARAAVTEGRDAVQGLRASTVVGNDLAQSINALGEELAADPTVPQAPDFQVLVEGTPRNLVPILRDEVYQIAGEAMRNAFRHAHAKRIEVEIEYGERQLCLRVRDDGKGIDPKIEEEGGRAGHYGIPGMRERAKLIGADLDVWSEIQSGTEIVLAVPATNAYAKSPAVRRSGFSHKEV